MPSNQSGELIYYNSHYRHGVDDKRRAQGYFHATGIRPNCLERLASLGAALTPELFERRILGAGLA